MTKRIDSIVKICVCVLIAVSLCLIPSCKKSPEEPAGEGSSQQSISATPPETPAPSTVEPVAQEAEEPVETVTEAVAETPAPVEEEAPAAAADTAGLVPIDIKLPKPMFVGTPQDLVVRRARLAADCGCDGVVASPREVAAIRAACGDGLRIVTPGIRPGGADRQDQKRTASASDAIAAGATHLVVGRPIRSVPDPAAAAAKLAEEVGLALTRRGER